MERKHKIIVSVVGIFIILLALVGITYGYFLTKISGNTNEKSIYVTTANLELVYGDGTGLIEAYNIEPSNTLTYTKTFTVTNKGNASVAYDVYLENVINDLEHDEDLILKIECSSSITTRTCNGYGVFESEMYPKINTDLISNRIDVGETQTYTLTLQFLDDGTDQSIDMGKTIQGKVQIYDPNDIVALTGTVTNYETNYYVEMHSEVKMSTISSDGTYLIPGLTIGNHTLYVKYIDDNGDVQTVGEKTVNITKGEIASVSEDGTEIVIMDTTK